MIELAPAVAALAIVIIIAGLAMYPWHGR